MFLSSKISLLSSLEVLFWILWMWSEVQRGNADDFVEGFIVQAVYVMDQVVYITPQILLAQHC